MLARQEDHADPVFTLWRQRDTELCEFIAIKHVGDLNQDAGAISAQRVGTNGAAMIQILQDQERLLHQRVARAPPDVGNKSNATRIVFVPVRIQAMLGSKLNCGG